MLYEKVFKPNTVIGIPTSKSPIDISDTWICDMGTTIHNRVHVKMRYEVSYFKIQSLSCDKESMLKTFIWLCHKNICLCFNHLQVFTIKPLDIKHNECLTMLPFSDVEWNDQKKMKERSPNWYVVTQNISSQTSKELYEGNS